MHPASMRCNPTADFNRAGIAAQVVYQLR